MSSTDKDNKPNDTGKMNKPRGSTSDVFSLETPQLMTSTSGIDLNFLLNSGVPNTAEIIQKCLSVNPFDMKFREANLQINQGQPNVLLGSSQQLIAGTSSGLSTVLKLSSFSQSPEIFSNISVLTADRPYLDIEHELRKKLREKGLIVDKPGLDGESPRPAPSTADVLNAVLDMATTTSLDSNLGIVRMDMNMNQIAPISSISLNPSTTSLITGLKTNTIAAPANSIGLVHNLTNACLQTSTSLAGNTQLSSNMHPSNEFGPERLIPPEFQVSPANPLKRELSASLDSLSKNYNQRNSIVNDNALNHIHFQQPTFDLHRLMPSILPKQQLGNQISPLERPHSSDTNLRPPQIAVVDTSVPTSSNSNSNNWNLLEMKPVSTSNNRPASHSPNMISMKAANEVSTEKSIHGNRRRNSQGGKEKGVARRYTKSSLQSSSNADAQVTSTRGGRGRRSIISEIPPDERRVTILERNKAAAVRYRKRKKEEHDDMQLKVNRLEQDKCALETQNSVLRRELERLSSLLQIRDSTSRISPGTSPMNLTTVINSAGNQVSDDYCPNNGSAFSHPTGR